MGEDVIIKAEVMGVGKRVGKSSLTLVSQTFSQESCAVEEQCLVGFKPTGQASHFYAPQLMFYKSHSLVSRYNDARF